VQLVLSDYFVILMIINTSGEYQMRVMSDAAKKEIIRSIFEIYSNALEENNTTKPVEKNIPGGLGFKIICDFARLNNGKVQIVSSDGCWQLIRGKEEAQSLQLTLTLLLKTTERTTDSFNNINLD
jgi:hypothetical protein